MKDHDLNFKAGVKLIQKVLLIVFSGVALFSCFLIYVMIDPNLSLFKNNTPAEGFPAVNIENRNDEWDKIENGIHVRTGLVDGEGLMVVVTNCTSCHSAKLVMQNRMSREHWAATIDWMQETQNLWDLGANEEIIINYLTTYYPPAKTGRRSILKNIEWYELED